MLIRQYYIVTGMPKFTYIIELECVQLIFKQIYAIFRLEDIF